ncbi:hypothetical protein BH10PSE14_BH10PSE14_13640 [soil metagenome]
MIPATGPHTRQATRARPRREVPLAEAAARVALCARPLLAASRGELLTLTAPTRPVGTLTTMYWNGQSPLLPLPPVIALLDDSLQHALALFEDAGRLLLAELVRRWPANALPPAIGVVTDGTGVGFSSDHPSPMWPDWLALHLTGACAATSLLPFSPIGAWARLTAPVMNRQLH